MGPDHTPKIAMPMTAASVAQRRMGFKAPRAQKYEGQSPTWFPKDSAGGGVTNRIEERGHPPLDTAGGGHMATLSPKDGREQASKGRFVGLTSAQDASGESSGR